MATSEAINRLINPFVLHLKKMELELNCPTCLKVLNQPMLLPCDHILCSHCSGTSKNDAYICPDCRLPYERKDLRPATHIERFLTIYKNMSYAISTLQQSSSFGISGLEVPFNRTPVSCDNHADKKLTNIVGAESFVDQGQLSPPTDNFRDSDSESWDKEGQLGAKRKFADMLPEEGPNCGTKHARFNDSAESMKDQLKSVSNKLDDESTIMTCVFCHSFRTTEASGEMLHYLNEEPVSGDQVLQPNVIHVHRKCIDWTPQVYYSGERAVNLETEISRASKIKCCSCGLKGAALGCYIKSCKRSFHVPCAYKILECRWDVENYLVLCPVHASRKLPCDKLKYKKSKSSSIEPLVSSAWMPSSSLSKDWLICGSDLSKEEKVILEEFTKLSGVLVTYQWKQNVTHVVAATKDGACIRTMKFLMAILNGIWVLNVGWIKACLEAERLVPEENYEITHDIHGCYDGPKSGRIRAMQQSPKLFNRLAFHFSGFIEPSYKSNLERLATEAGGKVLSELELQNWSFSAAGEEIEKTFIVYSVEPPNDCDPLQIEIAEALAVKAVGTVVRHTLFLNAIAADDLQMLYEIL